MYKNPLDVSDNYTRNVMFPVFREMEMYESLKGADFNTKRLYYQNLENHLKDHFTKYENYRASINDNVMLNDEYWMFFIYGEALF